MSENKTLKLGVKNLKSPRAETTMFSVVLLRFFESSQGSSSSNKYEFQPLENFRVRVIHAQVWVRNQVKTFIVNLENILSKLKTDTSYMYFLLENGYESSRVYAFLSSSFLKFAPEMLQASSSESKDFRVLQSTSQARIRVSVTTLKSFMVRREVGLTYDLIEVERYIVKIGFFELGILFNFLHYSAIWLYTNKRLI